LLIFIFRCKIHGKQETFQCSSSNSFKKILTYNPEIYETPSKFDIEDLDKQLQYEDKKILNTPLIAELSIFENDEFISDENLKKNIQIFQKKMKKDKNVCDFFFFLNVYFFSFF